MNVNDPRFGLAIYPFILLLFPVMVYLCIWLGDVWERAAARRRARMASAK